MPNADRSCLGLAIILATVTAFMSGCTVNTFNCNVKEACRPDAPTPASTVSPAAAR